MGIETLGAQFLCGARNAGVDFSMTATLGRQSFFPCAVAAQNVSKFVSFQGNGAELLQHCGGNGDRFLSLLGAKRVVAVDKDGYEGAELLHDLNEPLAKEHHKRFSAVIDGGTIEHVFHSTLALKSALEMVAVGGHFIALQMANNFLGHGFYQFSPEFFFSSLSPQNGFQITAFLLGTPSPIAFYKVPSPDTSNARVTLVNDRPVFLFVAAKRIAETSIFEVPPQQHYYQTTWDRTRDLTAGLSSSRGQMILDQLSRLVPSRIKEASKMLFGYNKFAFANFTPFTAEQVASGDVSVFAGH